VARVSVADIEIAYELLGDPGAPAVVVTPGGRFSKQTPGVPELAAALASGGRRVLLWDRPNCGASDICFDGPSESEVNARTLVGIIRELGLGPVALAAGSAGSRITLIAAARAPELVSHLVIWWVSGGPISLAQLAAYYCGDSAMAAARGGMEAVAALPAWAEQIALNPRNRDIILAQDPDTFIETMQRWALSYAYSHESPVPGMSRQDFGRLRMPALVFRSGKSDLSHTRRTSEWVHELIPHSRLIEPPWPDQEWNNRSTVPAGPVRALFGNWPKLAPYILDFTGGAERGVR
jgi:pimeloyl-ACP methyl ester carboxylesterase